MNIFLSFKKTLIFAAFIMLTYTFPGNLIASSSEEEYLREDNALLTCTFSRVNEYLINEKCDKYGYLSRRETYFASTNDIVKFEKFRTLFGITYPVHTTYYEKFNGKKYRVQDEGYKVENGESVLSSVKWNEVESGKSDYYYPNGKLWKTKIYNPKTNTLQWIIEYQEDGTFKSIRTYSSGVLLRGVFFDELGNVSKSFDSKGRITSTGTASLPRMSSEDPGLAFFDAINADKQSMNNNVDFIALGDSITAGWKSDSEKTAIWNNAFGNLKPLLAGVGYDQTSNILWRINNGNIDGVQPKVIMLMIGTNNLNFSTKSEETAQGIATIIARLKAQLPESNILLMGVAPRLDFKDERVRAVNDIISLLDVDPQVTFIDLRTQFTTESGKINENLYDFDLETNSRDEVHLGTEGYRVWADTISSLVQSLYTSGN